MAALFPIAASHNMTAICGAFERGVRQVSNQQSLSRTTFATQAVALMLPTLAQFKPDATFVWLQQEVGLGQQTLWISSESRRETLSWPGALPGLAITAQARLDNRHTLCQIFAVPPAEENCWPDSRLILHAYEKWGVDCPAHLLGDFAFAIWDARCRRLFCCRDHTGVYPFFYFHDNHRFAFASRIEALLTVPGIERRLNRTRVAALASRAARFAQHEHTFYDGILSLPAATSLQVDEAGLRQRVYWRPEDAPTLPYRTDTEVLEAFRALFVEVISTRLRSDYPVGAQLSGGLDSSGIVSVAAKLLEARGQTLTTFSSVLPAEHAHELTDERAFIDLFRDWPNIKRHYISAPGSGPFDNLETVVRAYESPLISTAHYVHTAIAQAARAAGVRVLLDGVHGEIGPSNDGSGHYAELFWRLRWPALWRGIAARSRVEHKTRQQLFRTQVLAEFRPANLREPQAPPALQPAFVKRHLAPVHAKPWRLPNQRQQNLERIKLVMLKHARGGDGVYHGAEPITFGLPYRDKRLLEFCLNVPANLKIRDGYARYLLRAGLDGCLPPKIQGRIDKQPFAPDYHERYRAQRRFAQDYLAAIAPNDPVREVVAVETLKELARHERTANPDDVPAGIYLLCFLRQFAEFRR